MKNLFLFFLLLFTTNMFSQTQEQIDEIRLLIKNKDYAQGISILNSLIENNSANTLVYQTYAEVLLSMQRPSEALTNIQLAIRFAQNNSTNHLIAGNIYRNLNDFTNAQKEYQTAIKLSPNNANGYLEFALLNIEHYKFNDAMRLIQLAKNYEPNSWMVRLVEAKIAIAQKNNDRARAILFNAINEFPYEEIFITALAELYYSENKFQQAVTLLQEANKRFGDSVERLLIIADILFVNKEYDSALKYFNQAESVIPPYSSIEKADLLWKFYNLNRIIGDEAKALPYLKEALQLDPFNQMYLLGYYDYLMEFHKPTDPERVKASQTFYDYAQNERNKGIGRLYVSLLQKSGLLNPQNIETKDRLLEYTQITKNEFEINNILQEIAEIDTTNSRISNRIQLRQHLATKKLLDQSQQQLYQYKNKVFIMPTFNLSARLFATELTNVEKIYGTVKSTVEYTVPFSQRSLQIFQGNTNFNLVTHISMDTLSNMKVVVYTKNGNLLTNLTMRISKKDVTKTISDYTKILAEQLPPIGVVNKRLPDSTLGITIGELQNIQTNQQFVIFNDNEQILGQGTITSTTNRASLLKLTSPETLNMIKQYVAPIEYFPLVNTNTNTKTKFNLFNIFQPEDSLLNF